MQAVKANAPWRLGKQDAQASTATEERGCAFSRNELLAARALLEESQSQPLQLYGLRAIPFHHPPGLQQIQQEPELLDSDVSTTTSEHDSLPKDDLASSSYSADLEEYHVLLQNLPKVVLKESWLRDMVKEAKLKNIKKLAFRSDGRALITLTSYTALCQCIEHFNGLPWIHAPTCWVPSITASRVLNVKSSKSSAEEVAPQQLQCQLSADAPVSEQPQQPVSTLSADANIFVPGAAQFTTKITSAESSILLASTDKKREPIRCSSRASTGCGSSSDEASGDEASSSGEASGDEEASSDEASPDEASWAATKHHATAMEEQLVCIGWHNKTQQTDECVYRMYRVYRMAQ